MAEVEVDRVTPRTDRSSPFAEARGTFRDIIDRTAVGRNVVRIR